MKIALFYRSSTCYTEIVAEKICDILGDSFVSLRNVNDTPPEIMKQYDILILNIPTWDFGEIQENWLAISDTPPSLELHNKIVAMYGMGEPSYLKGHTKVCHSGSSV